MRLVLDILSSIFAGRARSYGGIYLNPAKPAYVNNNTRITNWHSGRTKNYS